MNISAEQVSTALSGMPFPARLWQISAWAEHNGAGQPVREALLNIPARTYADVAEVADAVYGSAPGVIAPTRPCHHRRHPKNCRGHGWHFNSDQVAS